MKKHNEKYILVSSPEVQVKELREFKIEWIKDVPLAIDIMREAADTIETLVSKLEAKNMDSCQWISCSIPPSHTKEVLIFNGKSYSVGYYDGKEWVNAIHPVEWQEIKHRSKCKT